VDPVLYLPSTRGSQSSMLDSPKNRSVVIYIKMSNTLRIISVLTFVHLVEPFSSYFVSRTKLVILWCEMRLHLDRFLTY
jgi:hypothetical protein